ncbi:DUF5375 family protein [Pectobacterium odoriferum]|uniref:DUF5375 family protein n=1 Tax=Pectobacterium odoriferum TaxID=78398 RepID=UPI000CD1E5B8|nr:DUF5375 family protein [Pectobacterium odoriferum]POD97055.1 hypothetical protein BVY06_07010 [Pectobacterium odoriferum]
MNINNQSCIPLEVRTAVYRRAVAQAYLDNCRETGIALNCNLTELEIAIALELEEAHVREHGTATGMEIACAMLGDMVQPTLLTDKPRLTALGHIIMGELCQCATATTPTTTLH